MVSEASLNTLINALSAYNESQDSLNSLVQTAHICLGNDWISTIKDTVASADLPNMQKDLLLEKVEHAIHYYGALAAWEEASTYLATPQQFKPEEIKGRIETLDYWLSLFGNDGTQLLNQVKQLITSQEVGANATISEMTSTETQESTQLPAEVIPAEESTPTEPESVPSIADMSPALDTKENTLPQTSVPDIEEEMTHLAEIPTEETAVILPTNEIVSEGLPNTVQTMQETPKEMTQLPPQEQIIEPQQESLQSQEQTIETKQESVLPQEQTIETQKEAVLSQEQTVESSQESVLPQEPITESLIESSIEQIPQEHFFATDEQESNYSNGATYETEDYIQAAGQMPSTILPDDANLNIPKTKHWEIEHILTQKKLYEDAVNWISAYCVRQDNMDRLSYPFFGFIVDVMKALIDDLQNVLENQLLTEVIEQEVEGGYVALERMKSALEEELNGLPDDLKNIQPNNQDLDAKALLGGLDTSTETEYIGPAPDGFEVLDDPYAVSSDEIIKNFEETERLSQKEMEEKSKSIPQEIK